MWQDRGQEDFDMWEEGEARVGLYCRLLAPRLYLQDNSAVKNWASIQMKIK